MEFRYLNAEVERDRNAVIETLREKEHHYKNILESLPAAVYTCDKNGYITFYNKAAADLWGREPQIGKDKWTGSWKIYDANGERLMPEACPMAMSINKIETVHGQEIIIERPDGSHKTVLCHPQLFFDEDGNVKGGMNMLVDVTLQKRTEASLKLLKENENALRQTNSSLQDINKELEQFAYITSHDLQEPVRKIQIYGERLKKNNEAHMDEVSTGYLDKILLATGRMRGLINDVLNFSRIANQPNLFVKTNLNSIYKSVLDDLELRIEQKKALISCSALPEAEVIPFQMTQLFYNIIGNSLKFTVNEQVPVIQVISSEINKKEVADSKLDSKKKFFEIIFKDNGIGFNKDFAENVFGVFNRASENHDIEGSGIGLAICRKIVTAHKGEIFAKSVPGVGTEIHVLLPYSQ
jgi:PAS domain S-box-containing protein